MTLVSSTLDSTLLDNALTAAITMSTVTNLNAVNGPCLLDYLIIELILPVVLYEALPFTLDNY